MLKKPNERLKRQRAGGDPDVSMMSRQELLYHISDLPLKYQALVAFLYLTGCRVSELVGNKSRDYPRKPIFRHQVERTFFNNVPILMIKDVPVLKRKSNMTRNVPVVIEREKPFVDILLAYIKNMGMDDVLFPMTRQTAWKIVNKQLGLWPHYFRHLRNTHLTREYGLSGHELKNFNGWASAMMADNYVHLNWRDIASKMIQKS